MNIVIENNHLLITLDEKAKVSRIFAKEKNRNILKEQTAFAKLVLNDKSELCANSASYNDGILRIGFENGFCAQVRVETFDDFFKFTLLAVSNEDFWSLTFVNLLTDVADTGFMTSSIGLTLNVKTAEYPGKNQELSATVYTHIGIENAALAVIGIQEDKMNGVMREIVDKIPFGQMPKGAYSGPYAKDCKDANRTYAIRVQPLTDDNIDEYIELLNDFRITQVNFHQAHMFRTGDFEVYNKEIYPNGRADLKHIVDKLHQNGINAMVHSYAFFIDAYGNPRDKGGKYLQPVPHEDLAISKTFTLACDIGNSDEEVVICEPIESVNSVFGAYIQESPVLRVDDELMYIQGIRNGKIFVLRGAFGTAVTAHKKDSVIKQLRAYFTHLMPERGSKLFYEIARNTAEFYNELDFDGFYIDAIDGVFALDSNEFSWYHATDFVNEIFKYLKKPPIFNCCYGPQYPGHWHARTLMGAFDTPGRGYRDFVDVHVDFNSKFAEKMSLVSELGWWQLFPIGQPVNWQKKVMWHEDVEYLMSKALATDASLCWLSSFEYYKTVPLLESYRPIIQEYTALRDNGYFSREIKEIVRQPQKEYHLCKKEDNYYFVHMNTNRQRIESFEEGRNILTYTNDFETQTPKIRIEALWSAQDYYSENAKVIAEFDQNKSVETGKKYNVKTSSTNKMRGMGVWIYGDGKGEVINIRLHSLKHLETGYGDHFVKIDFTGWRYYSFYEFQNAEMKAHEYPVEQLDYKVFEDTIPFYAVYDGLVDMDNLENVEVIVHPQGEYNIKLRDIVALPQVALELKKPTVKANGQTIAFDTVMNSGDYLEYDPITKLCVHYDGLGKELARPAVIGSIELQNGDNTVEFTAECDSPLVKRAALTFITLGDRI